MGLKPDSVKEGAGEWAWVAPPWPSPLSCSLRTLKSHQFVTWGRGWGIHLVLLSSFLSSLPVSHWQIQEILDLDLGEGAGTLSLPDPDIYTHCSVSLGRSTLTCNHTQRCT